MNTNANTEEPKNTNGLSTTNKQKSPNSEKSIPTTPVVLDPPQVAPFIGEPNDTLLQAFDSGLSSDSPGIFSDSGFIGDNPNVTPTDEVDLISFQLDAGDRATIDIDAQVFGSPLDSVLRLFDSAGNEVAVNDDSDGLDSFINFIANDTDTYFAGVSSFANFGYDPLEEGSGFDGFSTGDYDISIEVGPVVDDLEEPNDTIPQAVHIELERTFEASSLIGNNPNVTSTDDVDLISFELDAGDRVTIDIDAQVLGSSLDSVLRLFDSEGNQVAVNDDSDGLDSFINFTASAADTYFAGVSSFANFDYDPSVEGSGFNGFSTGDYDISIQLIPDGGDGELENGSFETGTFSAWRTIGDTSIETADFGVTPTDGSFQALLTNGFSDSGGSVIDSDLEEFLDLSSGVLDSLGNGDVTEGSAIKQTFTANAGDILTFDWNFLTNEATPEVTFNDFAFFSLTPFTLELADTTSPIFIETLADDFNEETGFQTASVAISESGTYTLSFGVADVGDDIVDSGLLVDNIQVVPSQDDGGQVFEDPSGDTFGFGFPQLDIESVSGTVSGGELTLSMDFFTPIAPPSTGLAESVVGFWDLDLDQNPATGTASSQSIFAPPDQQGGPLGVDVIVDLFSEQFQPGFVDLVDANGFFIGNAPITYDTDSLEILIPLSLLGDDGNLNYGTVIGTFGEPTDAAPNDEFGTVGASLSISDTSVSDGDRVWEPLSQSEVPTQKPTENSDKDRNLLETSDNIISSSAPSSDRQSQKDVKENQQNEPDVLRRVPNPPTSNVTIENGGFETGTFADWRMIGDTSIQTDEFGTGPSDGTFQALLTNGASNSGGSVVDSDLEEFLNLAPGVLDGLGNGDATEGSAIKQTFTANAGDILTFDWNFLTNEETPEDVFNDFAFFSLTPFTLELADTKEPIFFETLGVGFDEETGFQTATIAISESGTFNLDFGVVDVGDNIVDSALLIDNVRISSGGYLGPFEPNDSIPQAFD